MYKRQDVQCDTDQLPVLTQLLPPVPVACQPREAVRYVPEGAASLVLGDRIIVWWRVPEGELWSTHEAEITHMPNEESPGVYGCTYHGWHVAAEKVFFHNLAKDRATGAHPWSRVAPKKASTDVVQAANTAPAEAPAMPPAETTAAPTTCCCEKALQYLTGAATLAAGVADACVGEYRAMMALFGLDASNSAA